MNGLLEEYMGGLIVCVSFLVSCLVIRVNLPWLMNSLEGIYDSRVPFGGSIFRKIKGVHRKFLFAFAVFQVPAAQNNQHSKAANFGVVVSATPHLL